jgi:hypothetical protein
MELGLLASGALRVSRIEKRLWLIWFCLFVITMMASAALTSGRVSDFPRIQISNLHRALRPEREAKQIEKIASVQGITSLRFFTTATSVHILRNEDLQDLSLSLEGRFSKSNQQPLQIEKTATSISIRVDDESGRLQWESAFDDGNNYSELTVVLPRQFSGRIEIETVSGAVQLTELSLSEVVWKSLTGTLQSRGGSVHVVHLQSLDGDVDFDGEAMEFVMSLTSAKARVVLQGLEHIANARIDLQSVSGQIDAAISEKASLRISLMSFTGQSSSTIDLKKSMHSGGALEGQLGAGVGELRLRSVSGTTRLTTF